jgi:methionyl-tRNA formyltransferase
VESLDRIVRDGHEIIAVYTQPDKPAGRGNQISSSPVKQYATDHGIPVLQPAKIRTPDALETFRNHRADAAVVVAYGRILPEGFLNAFPMGAINVHFSLLPKFRGAAPVNWAIVHGESKSGVTTMQMDAGLDTGPILMQREIEIEPDETAIELMKKLSSLGAELLSETLTNYSSLAPQQQDEAAATLAPIMKKEDGLISWMLNARDISNRVRGFQPFPTAFTHFRGKKLTLWKTAIADAALAPTHPGEVIEASGDRLMIYCGGDSVLQVHELQLEGKRRVSARDFINGVRPNVGELIGT